MVNKLLEYRNKIKKGNCFGVIDFSKDDKLGTEDGVPNNSIFRFWDVHKPSRCRVLRGNMDFNPYRDSIYDYPLIAMHKLHKNDWEQFNKSCMIQVGACCGFVCWHCYLGQEHISGNFEGMKFLTAKEIVDNYIDELDHYDERAKYGMHLFRIHGGEPFLVPELILQILQELKRHNKHNDVFVWTETNMAPFYKNNSTDKSMIEQIGFDLQQLNEFDNWALHPCFHGISQEDYDRNIVAKGYTFSGFLKAFEFLTNSGIDLYPTFGSNVNASKEVVGFFNSIKQININMLFRIALIEYKTYYSTVSERLGYWDSDSLKEKMINIIDISNGKNDVIRKWCKIIENVTGKQYMQIERMRVKV